MKTFLQDVRYGFRMLLKHRSVTLIAVLTLSVGIGANTAIFGLIDKVLLQSLPVREPEGLVLLKAESVNPKLTFSEFSWADYLDYRAKNQVFTTLAAFSQVPVNFGAGDQMERVRAELISENYFELLGAQTALGRAISPEENQTPGAHPVAVISQSLWQNRFNGDRQVIGRTIELNDLRYTIVGVAQAAFHGIDIEQPTDVWVPAMMKSQVEQMRADDARNWTRERGYGAFQLIGRLRPGLPQEAARTGMDTLARQIRDSWMPESDRNLPFNDKRILFAQGARGLSKLRDEMGQAFTLLFALVGVVLLIACANIANLLLARSVARRKEIAVRLALGASRGRLIRQLLTESVILAGIGGLAGLLVAPWLSDLLLSFQAKSETAAQVLGPVMNWRIAGFTAAISVLTGVLFGLIPALQSLTPDLIPALKEDGAYRRDSRGFNLSRRVLIVMQIALSVVVLICAGLFVRSLGKIYSIDPGFRIDNVLIAELQLPMNKYNEEKSENFYQQLVDQLKALPGVESVAMSAYTPLSGSILIQTVVPEGQEIKPSEMPMTDANNVGAGYHEMMGIPLLQGRGFTPEDRKGAPLVAIVNEAFARRFFPDGNAYGKRIGLGVGKPLIEIVGVTRNIKSMSLESEDRPQLDLPAAQQGLNNPMRVMLRTRDDAAAMLPALRRTVRAMDPGLAFFKTTTLENDLRATISLGRMIASLLSLFGGVALMLAAVGLYGVISYAVEYRTREIGIRMALGAQARDILSLMMREGVLLLLIGLVLGIGTAAASMRLIESHLHNVRPTDPVTFVAITLLLSFIALLASYLPARRAIRVDPVQALRRE